MWTNRWDVYLGRRISTSAAQRVTAVWTGGGWSSLTLAMSRADTASLGVGAAVVGRAFDVDELRVADRLASRALLSPAEQRRRRTRGGRRCDHRSRLDLDRLRVLVLQRVADASKHWQWFPAGPDGTRAWDTVTATLGRHQLHHGLRIIMIIMIMMIMIIFEIAGLVVHKTCFKWYRFVNQTQWLKCNGPQGNTVPPPLIYGSKRSPTWDCFTAIGRSKRARTGGPNLNVPFPTSNFALLPWPHY